MYSIFIYNSSLYESFEVAKELGAVYQTNFMVSSPNDFSGLEDVLCLIGSIVKCADSKGDVVAGIYHDNDFIKLPIEEVKA